MAVGDKVFLKPNIKTIIGTAQQVTDGEAELKLVGNGLQDITDTVKTLPNYDDVLIIGIDAFTENVDFSAYTGLNILVEPGVTIGNSTYSLTLGDFTRGNIYVSDNTNIVYGSNCNVVVNNLSVINAESLVTQSVVSKGVNLNTTGINKNAIINGNFDVWQRATTATGNGYNSDDRWKNTHVGSTKTHSQQAFTLGQTDVPNNPKYFSRTIVTSVVGVSNFMSKQQKIEGVETFAGETVALSFYAKADANKNMALSFYQFFGSGGSGSVTVYDIGVNKFALTTIWQKFTFQIAIPSVFGKTLGEDINDYLNLEFFFDAGSDFDTRTDSLGQQSGTFDIAQVQLEKGSIVTDFERRTYGQELLLCQRYLEA